MHFSGISWVGLSVVDFGESVEFFERSVGMRMIHHDADTEVAHFRLTNGDLFEIFGPKHPEAVGGSQPITLAFEVEDLVATKAEMESSGVEFVTDIERWQDHAWCYFRGPQGLVFEIKQSGRMRS